MTLRIVYTGNYCTIVQQGRTSVSTVSSCLCLGWKDRIADITHTFWGPGWQIMNCRVAVKEVKRL